MPLLTDEGEEFEVVLAEEAVRCVEVGVPELEVVNVGLRRGLFECCCWWP